MVWRAAASLLVVIWLSAGDAAAQFCPPPDAASPFPLDQSSAGLFVRGMGYLESNCLPEARALLEGALRLEQPSPTARLTLALKLLTAREALAAGRRPEAMPLLREIVRDLPGDVVKAAVETLAQLLADRHDDPDWPLLERALIDLGHRGYAYADLLLRDHQAAVLGPAAAAQNLESVLEHETRPQRVLMLQVLLADLYLRAGRTVDAALLVASLERDVGLSLLDLRGRLRFLEVGARVWKARVESGAAAAEAHLRAYETARDELRRVVGQ
jgi:hypothetical protein